MKKKTRGLAILRDCPRHKAVLSEIQHSCWLVEAMLLHPPSDYSPALLMVYKAEQETSVLCQQCPLWARRTVMCIARCSITLLFQERRLTRDFSASLLNLRLLDSWLGNTLCWEILCFWMLFIPGSLCSLFPGSCVSLSALPLSDEWLKLRGRVCSVRAHVHISQWAPVLWIHIHQKVSFALSFVSYVGGDVKFGHWFRWMRELDAAWL